MMLEGFVSGLITAFLLSLFGVDVMILEVLNSLGLSISFSESHYYVLFGLIGLIGGALKG